MCTRESLNLILKYEAQTESGMKKRNGRSSALCSLGLSSGGKKLHFSSTPDDKSHMCLMYILPLIVCLTTLVSYLTQCLPSAVHFLEEEQKTNKKNGNKVYLRPPHNSNANTLDIFQT